jgi:hypothetical protein
LDECGRWTLSRYCCCCCPFIVSLSIDEIHLYSK